MLLTTHGSLLGVLQPLIRDADRRVPVVWIGDTVLQLPTPGGFAEAFSITDGNLVLGGSDEMLLVWDLSEVVAGGDPAQIKCIALDNLRSRLKLLGPPDDSWIIEREGMVAIATRQAFCFTCRHKLHELADAPVSSLKEYFESPGWKVTEVTSDQRLICERESDGRKLSAIFPVPIEPR